MTLKLGPNPRLRINSSVKHYVSAFRGMLSDLYESDLAVDDLERQIERRVGRKHCIAMPMARTGIYATIKNIVTPGQEVILSPYTIADVINMVVCAGAKPVFADLANDSCNICPKSIEELIGENTGAVMITHFYGLMSDVEAIKAICAKHDLPLIEDSAQAFGAVSQGTAAGSWSDAGIFSFGAYKNINSFLGGCVVTDDDELAARLRAEVKEWPLMPKSQYAKKTIATLITDLVTTPIFFSNLFFYVFRYAFVNDIDAINRHMKIDVSPELIRELPSSYKVRMSGVQADLVASQLGDKVEGDIEARIEAARRYHDGLKDIEELGLPPLREDYSHAYWYYPLQAPNRTELVKHAMELGRDITMSYHRNCAGLECFSEWARDCPEAVRTADSVIYLPTYPRYGLSEVDETIAAIRSFYGKTA